MSDHPHPSPCTPDPAGHPPRAPRTPPQRTESQLWKIIKANDVSRSSPPQRPLHAGAGDGEATRPEKNSFQLKGALNEASRAGKGEQGRPHYFDIAHGSEVLPRKRLPFLPYFHPHHQGIFGKRGVSMAHLPRFYQGWPLEGLKSPFFWEKKIKILN